MNPEFKKWLQEQTYTLNLVAGWKVIKKEYDKNWNWNWDDITEWDE